jgi:carbonic anhydrase
MKTLKDLFDRNREWAAARTAGDPAFFTRLTQIQAPDYLWIGCSDSRVPANEIVGRQPGELFVHRNVGNLFPPGDLNATAVLEYAVETLGVRHVIVCGHYRCGGVQAALAGEVGGTVGAWLAPLRNLACTHGEDLAAEPSFDARWDRLCELNVRAQVAALAGSQVARGAWARGQALALHGWIYDLSDGLLRDLDCGASEEMGLEPAGASAPAAT